MDPTAVCLAVMPYDGELVHGCNGDSHYGDYDHGSGYNSSWASLKPN